MITIEHLKKSFTSKDAAIDAVNDVSLSIADGEIYGVIGYSGAGKSTLVRCLNLLERPDAGSVTVNGTRLAWMEEDHIRFLPTRALDKARRGIGMIFQHFNLLDRSTVFDNIAYPLLHTGRSKDEVRTRVEELLALVDLEDKINAYPAELSGGQKQRVAIARALANDPQVLLSDEATSALDPEATEAILELLKRLNKTLGLTIVLITHEMNVIKTVCQKVAVMENGRIVESGNVYDVFAHPREEITKRFVGSTSPIGCLPKLIRKDPSLLASMREGRLVKLTFGRESVGEAVMSEVSRRYQVDVNIILANIEVLRGGTLGNLVASINGTTEGVSGTLEYFRECHVTVEVIDHA